MGSLFSRFVFSQLLYSAPNTNTGFSRRFQSIKNSLKIGLLMVTATSVHCYLHRLCWFRKVFKCVKQDSKILFDPFRHPPRGIWNWRVWSKADVGIFQVWCPNVSKKNTGTRMTRQESAQSTNQMSGNINEIDCLIPRNFVHPSDCETHWWHQNTGFTSTT